MGDGNVANHVRWLAIQIARATRGGENAKPHEIYVTAFRPSACEGGELVEYFYRPGDTAHQFARVAHFVDDEFERTMCIGKMMPR